MAAPKKQPLYLVKHSAKMDGGGQLHVPAALNKCQDSNHEGRWVGPQSGLKGVENRKIPCPTEVQLAP